MAYQLRFLKSNPIGAWLNQTAYILEVLIPGSTPSSGPTLPGRQNLRRVRKALAKGLSAFLEKKSMCDRDKNCDLSLMPVPENKSDNRFDEGFINAPVKRYMFRKGIDLSGAVQKIWEILLKDFPLASKGKRKIQAILKDSLTSHLFENPLCFHRPVCRQSHLMELSRDLADFRRHCPIPSPEKLA
jgi:hypothetical protein